MSTKSILATVRFDSNLDAQNFKRILDRKRGQKFYVASDGEFRTLSLSQRSKLLFSKSSRNEKNSQLQTEISGLMGRLKFHASPEEAESQKKALKCLFFHKMSRLSSKVFNREDVIKQLDLEVLSTIAAKYVKAKALVDTTHTPDHDLATRDENYFGYVLATGKLAMKLGIAPDTVDQGASGTYFVKDLAEKRIAVFKPSDEEPLAPQARKWQSRVKRFFVKCFPLFPTAIFCTQGRGYKAEVMASDISKRVGLFNVPNTKAVKLASPKFNYTKAEKAEEKLKKKEGSLQLFVPGTPKDGDAYLGINFLWCQLPKLGEWRCNLKSKKAELLQKLSVEDTQLMAILTYAEGDIDRHTKNIMFNQETKKLYCIDNGFSMTEKHPSNLLVGNAQYAWRMFPQSKEPFTAASKKIIAELVAKQDELIQEWKDKGYINEKQVKLFKERIIVLSDYAQSGKSPYDLAKIQKEKDFKEYFSKSRSVR
ncbi:MAG: hypothetical protein CK425_07490 [Parachlamydia sp.]|nr:MAG: hypothetical protein CK425_07490 [Parachlamydia sp.]